MKKRAVHRRPPSRRNEITAITLVGLSLLVFLCIVSASPSDPTFNSSTSQRAANWIGVVGAIIDDWLTQAVGQVKYLVPVLLGMIAWRVFRTDSLRPRVSRVISYLLFVASCAGIFSLVGWYGGLLGAVYSEAAVYLLNQVGAAILMLTTLVASAVLILNVSFAGLVSSFELAWENLMVRVNERLEKRRKARADMRTQAVGRSEKRKEARLGKLGVEPPSTLVVGETAEALVLKAKGAAAGGFATNAFATDGAAAARTEAEPVMPTIIDTERPSGNDTVPDTIVPGAAGSPQLKPAGKKADMLDVPIKPKRSTTDLDAAELPETKGESGKLPFPEASDPSTAIEEYRLPSTDLLHTADARIEQKEAELQRIARELSDKTSEFNVAGKVMHICPGPVVTTYEFKPDPGVKYSRVTGLVDDLCLALKAESIRIDRIPGKAYVGIEVPNKKRETIRLRDVIESKKFTESDSKLTIALGKTIDGLNYVTDLAKMPHLLIAGATGAGKSVGVNTLVVSILYKASPDDVKFIMVDPKRLELGVYADIPHLATEIITDPKRAAAALRWAVGEMERRYKHLAGFGVRNIDGYNAEIERRKEMGQLDDEGEPYQKLPYLVCIIDELADLMMVSGKEVEESITRLAQMARAVGIHLVLATQRPSVDVITGLIKANFPARIAFRVSQKVDSRTIIDANGAESLLGRGDMLFLPPASSQVVRVHGAFVDEKEIKKIVDHVKSQGNAVYDETITKTDEELEDIDDLPGKRDPLFWDAVRSVVHAKRASTSLLQRHLRIGYGRAAAILDAMVREGYIGDMDGSTRARPVLQKAYEDLQDVVEMGADV
ncbi:MAG TPA: DNA translocase FtsK 4TM domain-containing protein [Pyrinomonadaceae bacterium]|nr:DNA translocase FtsK 4TM domain-containing protein [Pyrinomonadaceae bacterium]